MKQRIVAAAGILPDGCIQRLWRLGQSALFSGARENVIRSRCRSPQRPSTAQARCSWRQIDRHAAGIVDAEKVLVDLVTAADIVNVAQMDRIVRRERADRLRDCNRRPRADKCRAADRSRRKSRMDGAVRCGAKHTPRPTERFALARTRRAADSWRAPKWLCAAHAAPRSSARRIRGPPRQSDRHRRVRRGRRHAPSYALRNRRRSQINPATLLWFPASRGLPV